MKTNEKVTECLRRSYSKGAAEPKAHFMHTNVPDPLVGKGIASALAASAFEYAKKINRKVMVYCPFVAAYLKKHPELKDQLDKQYLG